MFFFSKMLSMLHCDSEKGVSRSTFAKYSFGRKGGGHKKAYSQSVYALDNVDNAGRPLSLQDDNKRIVNVYVGDVQPPPCFVKINQCDSSAICGRK